MRCNSCRCGRTQDELHWRRHDAGDGSAVIGLRGEVAFTHYMFGIAVEMATPQDGASGVDSFSGIDWLQCIYDESKRTYGVRVRTVYEYVLCTGTYCVQVRTVCEYVRVLCTSTRHRLLLREVTLSLC